MISAFFIHISKTKVLKSQKFVVIINVKINSEQSRVRCKNNNKLTRLNQHYLVIRLNTSLFSEELHCANDRFYLSNRLIHPRRSSTIHIDFINGHWVGILLALYVKQFSLVNNARKNCWQPRECLVFLRQLLSFEA